MNTQAQTPVKDIENLRKAMASNHIDPTKKYAVDCGNGKIIEFTGSEMLKVGGAFLAFYDAQSRGDKAEMYRALGRLAAI